LEPGFKTPKEIDVDGFRRVDNGSIEGHNSWWKIYDISNAELYEKGDELQVSAVTKTAVDELHFGRDVTYVSEGWGSPIQLALDVRRDKKRRIIAYQLSHVGWVDFDTALRMTCHHEIDNARPIFPANGRPYIRTKKDQITNNNLSKKGIS
jgi:hypothetical protein